MEIFPIQEGGEAHEGVPAAPGQQLLGSSKSVIEHSIGPERLQDLLLMVRIFFWSDFTREKLSLAFLFLQLEMSTNQTLSRYSESEQKLYHGAEREMAGDEVDGLLGTLSYFNLTSSSQAKSIVRWIKPTMMAIVLVGSSRKFLVVT